MLKDVLSSMKKKEYFHRQVQLVLVYNKLGQEHLFEFRKEGEEWVKPTSGLSVVEVPGTTLFVTKLYTNGLYNPKEKSRE